MSTRLLCSSTHERFVPTSALPTLCSNPAISVVVVDLVGAAVYVPGHCAAVLLYCSPLPRSVVHGMHMVASCAQSSQDMTKYQPSFRVVLDAPFPKPASGVVQLHVFLDETVVEASILWCLLDLGFRHITLCGSGWIRILTLSPLVVRLHNAGLCIGLRVPKHRCTQPGRMRLHNTQQSCAGHYGSGFPAPRQRDPIRIVRVMRGQ